MRTDSSLRTLLVFGAPVAAIATWTLLIRLRSAKRRALEATVLLIFGLQLTLGILATIERLRGFGPTPNTGVPVDILALIRTLPPESKLGYGCRPLEEIAFWNPALVSIEAHTGRRVVPMCFQADIATYLNSGVVTPDVESVVFRWAPQRELYPRNEARPSSAEVASFLKKHDIDYIYEDAAHPNSLVPEAIPVATNGTTRVLRIP